jgi:hypothetical protein
MHEINTASDREKDKSINSSIEIRCNNDHILLFIASGIDKGQIETVCRKCKQKRLIKFPVLPQAKAL